MDKLTVAIQAGGKSSRMGTDKSFVLFQGRPLIEVVRAAVEGLGDELILITNKPDAYAHLGLPMHGDLYPDTGPLGGIYTALHYAAHPHVLTVACDMPWLNRPLLDYMAGLRGSADVIVPRWDKFPEPLHAVYSQACLGPIREKLEAQMYKITAFYGRVAVRFVERAEIEAFDPQGKSFVNVNTAQDLAEEERRESKD
ncbi:MAG: molybdenum cofactor guanylyltransferase [Anaerolineae bacterium]|uniref:molybdenum cofactor guanylyltransferase n=1 Tax=Promineifilum sp. TaxID=2664178 RepID=UPI001D7D14BB|nr:molybdenum cofactor guanylyltransferase [Anaerolineales bacterium]MCB8934783.1 molybdenum cofactor guanylyltransferase [Promineifilum sp.]MCO5182073.1 molybdenum cofactor guanylyltransferase [Promineifilum sp.]MCW5847156.1 molybdenum cofactor guanylyltransferase [Anaerolineae bacterium]